MFSAFKKCEHCKRRFEITKRYRLSRARFCSLKCHGNAHAETTATLNRGKRSGDIATCTECGQQWYRYPSQKKRGYLRCSKQCSNRYIQRLYKADKSYADRLNTARPYIDHTRESTRRKLSKAMKKAFAEGRLKPRIGAASNFWKGGIASLQNSLRHTPRYNRWRKAVYGRDEYRCRHCGAKKDLHAHHIKSFAKYPKLRYTVSNGITVCQKCHSAIHDRNVPTPKRHK